MFILSHSHIQKLVAQYGINFIMDNIVAGLETEFQGFDPKITHQPIRSGFDKTNKGLVEWMPILVKENYVYIKIVSYFPQNPLEFKPTIQSQTIKISFQDGSIIEMADSTLLTAIRTGAASLIASKILASPYSKVLGLVGCGAQSITQAHALSRYFSFEEILAYDTCIKTMNELPEKASFLNIPVKPVALKELEKSSDIICTATSVDVGAGPVINGNNLKPHVHINAVGADFPGKIELPADVMRKSFVTTDHIGQALKEGECQIFKDASEIEADIFQLVKNPKKYEQYKNQRTVFDSTGMPLEDSVALDMVCALAYQSNLGLHLNDEFNINDPKNPYEWLRHEKAVVLQELMGK